MLRATFLLLLAAPELFAAQTTARITGKITNAATHQPIAKVHVSCTVSGQFVGTLSGADGSYTLEEVPAGQVRMTVNLEGYRTIFDPDSPASLEAGGGRQSVEPSFPLTAGDTMTRNFEMHPLGRIFGHLVDRDTGKPILGHTVSAVRRGYQPGQIYTIDTLGFQNGEEFDIRNLEAGDYFLRVDPEEQGKFVFGADAPPEAAKKCYGHTWYPDVPRMEMAARIHIGEGENRPVFLTLQSREMHWLSATVRSPREFENQPVTLALQAADGSSVRGVAATMPATGPFRIENLAPGSYRLSITAGGLPNNVKTFADYIDAQAFSAGRMPTAAAADATFEIANHDVGDFKIALMPFAGVNGEVRMLEKDAKLPDGIVMSMMPASEGPVFMRGVKVEGGRFHQDSLRPGEYWPKLAGMPEGYAIAQILFEGATPRKSTMTLSAPDTPLTFVITGSVGAISGVARNDDQSPLENAYVVLLPDPLPDRPDRDTIAVRKSGAEGAFLFRNLAAGKYRAVILTGNDIEDEGDIARLRERAARADAIEVAAGQALTVNLKR